MNAYLHRIFKFCGLLIVFFNLNEMFSAGDEFEPWPEKLSTINLAKIFQEAVPKGLDADLLMLSKDVVMSSPKAMIKKVNDALGVAEDVSSRQEVQLGYYLFTMSHMLCIGGGALYETIFPQMFSSFEKIPFGTIEDELMILAGAQSAISEAESFRGTEKSLEAAKALLRSRVGKIKKILSGDNHSLTKAEHSLAKLWIDTIVNGEPVSDSFAEGLLERLTKDDLLNYDNWWEIAFIMQIAKHIPREQSKEIFARRRDLADAIGDIRAPVVFLIDAQADRHMNNLVEHTEVSMVTTADFLSKFIFFDFIIRGFEAEKSYFLRQPLPGYDKGRDPSVD